MEAVENTLFRRGQTQSLEQEKVNLKHFNGNQLKILVSLSLKWKKKAVSESIEEDYVHYFLI